MRGTESDPGGRMNVEDRKQCLRGEIAVLACLIEEWKALNDPEIKWAVPVLEYYLERYEQELSRLVE